MLISGFHYAAFQNSFHTMQFKSNQGLFAGTSVHALNSAAERGKPNGVISATRKYILFSARITLQLRQMKEFPAGNWNIF